MRIKSNYVLQNVADEYLIVPIAEEADRLHGVIKLNETGAFLWNCLIDGVESKDELEKAILREYNADHFIASQDIDGFVSKLKSIGCLEE